jgi:hypothetical protein
MTSRLLCKSVSPAIYSIDCNRMGRMSNAMLRRDVVAGELGKSHSVKGHVRKGNGRYLFASNKRSVIAIDEEWNSVRVEPCLFLLLGGRIATAHNLRI